MDVQKILTILVKAWCDQHGQKMTSLTIKKKEKNNENIPA